MVINEGKLMEGIMRASNLINIAGSAAIGLAVAAPFNVQAGGDAGWMDSSRLVADFSTTLRTASKAVNKGKEIPEAGIIAGAILGYAGVQLTTGDANTVRIVETPLKAMGAVAVIKRGDTDGSKGIDICVDAGNKAIWRATLRKPGVFEPKHLPSGRCSVLADDVAAAAKQASVPFTRHNGSRRVAGP
jgi:hypothetical protein